MNFSQSAVILFTVTLDSTGTDPVILASVALPLRSNRADIPFDTLCTRPPARRGAFVIALTFSSYYMLAGRNLTPQKALSLCFWLLFPSRCCSFLIRRPSKRLPRDKAPMSQRVRGWAGTLQGGCDKASLAHSTQGSVRCNRAHKVRKINCGDCKKTSLCNNCRHFHHAKCLRHFTQRRLRGVRRRGKKEGVWAQRKRQSKLLTGSHGNREEADKRLPRKTGRITTQNTFSFETCKVLVSRPPYWHVHDSGRALQAESVRPEKEREKWVEGVEGEGLRGRLEERPPERRLLKHILVGVRGHVNVWEKGSAFKTLCKDFL